MAEPNALYLILSDSGSLPARLIRRMTGDPYSHCSLALSPSLTELYAFGRRRVNCPLIGGFVVERPGIGIYEKFPDTRCQVFRCPVSESGYAAAKAAIGEMLEVQKQWRYSFLGVFLAKFGVALPRKRRMYCSEFARHILLRSGVDLSELPPVCRPCDFLRLSGVEPVYTGRLNEYSRVVSEK